MSFCTWVTTPSTLLSHSLSLSISLTTTWRNPSSSSPLTAHRHSSPPQLHPKEHRFTTINSTSETTTTTTLISFFHWLSRRATTFELMVWSSFFYCLTFGCKVCGFYSISEFFTFRFFYLGFFYYCSTFKFQIIYVDSIFFLSTR